MSKDLIVNIGGLITTANDYKTPEGSLSIAENVHFNENNVLAAVKGRDVIATYSIANKIIALFKTASGVFAAIAGNVKQFIAVEYPYVAFDFGENNYFNQFTPNGSSDVCNYTHDTVDLNENTFYTGMMKVSPSVAPDTDEKNFSSLSLKQIYPRYFWSSGGTDNNIYTDHAGLFPYIHFGLLMQNSGTAAPGLPYVFFKTLAQNKKIRIRITKIHKDGTSSSAKLHEFIESSPSDSIVLNTSGFAAVQDCYFIFSECLYDKDKNIYIRVYASETVDSAVEPSDELFLIYESLPYQVYNTIYIKDGTLPLYTNASQEGIINENFFPPSCSVLTNHKNRIFMSGVINEHKVYEMTGTATDIQIYTYNNSGSRAHYIFKKGTKFFIAESFIEYYLNSQPTLPGTLTWVNLNRIYFYNRVYFSKERIGAAVPPLNYFDVGSSKKKIIGLASTGDYLFIFKEDGIFVLTGGTPLEYRLQLFDANIILYGKPSVIDDSIYFISNAGIMRLRISGIECISNVIRDIVDGGVNTQYTEFSAVLLKDREIYFSFQKTKNSVVTYITLIYNTLTNAWTTLGNSTKFIEKPLVFDGNLYYIENDNVNQYICKQNNDVGSNQCKIRFSIFDMEDSSVQKYINAIILMLRNTGYISIQVWCYTNLSTTMEQIFLLQDNMNHQKFFLPSKFRRANDYHFEFVWTSGAANNPQIQGFSLNYQANEAKKGALGI